MSHPPPPRVQMGLDAALAALRAAGEETRLRLLVLLAEGDLTVSDLTDILGQSQPRISRHLKLMVDAGLITRHREGSWAFFRLARQQDGAPLAQWLVAGLAADDVVLQADRDRLTAVRAARTAAAQAYFAKHAGEWDRIRSLHVAEAQVAEAIRSCLGPTRMDSVLDLGTGTGQMLRLLAPQAERLMGLDVNASMLAVARAQLEAEGLHRIELRQGDLYALPVERESFDLVVLHQVLHYLDDPLRALREAAQAVRAGGRVLVVDFAPHDLEFLRDEQAHRRLGFSESQMRQWFSDARLNVQKTLALPPPEHDKPQLTVTVWLAQKPKPQ
jgi:ubiquinone/menaquinone biosynthesis C-methylase UbiE/DNA-binding transcriptional ArsR family regulator